MASERVVGMPGLANPLKYEFSNAPLPEGHRHCRRDIRLNLPDGSYLRGMALDWTGEPVIVVTWSEPVPDGN